LARFCPRSEVGDAVRPKTTGCISKVGAQWRHLQDEYGKWNSVFRRYRRWVKTGVFDAMLETLAEMAGRDGTADMIDRPWSAHIIVQSA